MVPRSVLPLGPAGDEHTDRVTDVEPLSPLEVHLAGMQSVGSWRGFLAYATAAGILAWVGLYTDTDTIYLLIAAMLVAPFASPAMNMAIGTARGDGRLMARSLARYALGLAVATSVAGLLSLLTGQSAATRLMVATANLSDVALLLPLVAGAAGALSQVQASRASLVSGAAVGLLVAASLAPPAALIGMAAALGALLSWQFASAVPMRQGSAAQRATEDIEALLATSRVAEVVEVRARYPRPPAGGERVLLCEVIVRPQGDPDVDAVTRRVTAAIRARLRERGLADPVLVDVTVLEAVPSAGASSSRELGQAPHGTLNGHMAQEVLR
jgi:hypothetical protein